MPSAGRTSQRRNRAARKPTNPRSNAAPQTVRRAGSLSITSRMSIMGRRVLAAPSPSLCRQARRLPRDQLPAVSAAPVHSEIPNAKRVDLAARFDPHRRAARYNRARADDPDLACLRRDRGVPKGAAPQELQELRPRVLGTVSMGVRKIRGEERRERTRIRMHHGRKPPILGRKNLSDGRAIALCGGGKGPKHPYGNDEW